MSENYEVKLKKLARIFLESEKKMIRRDDLLAYVHDAEILDSMISDLLERFEPLGYEMIRTKYLNDVYYVLTSSGVDKNLTPTMYGALAILLALNREFGKDLQYLKAKELFIEIWDQIEFLIENNYLDKITIKGEDYVVLTPVGKAMFKNVIANINIEQILKNLSPES